MQPRTSISHHRRGPKHPIPQMSTHDQHKAAQQLHRTRISQTTPWLPKVYFSAHDRLVSHGLRSVWIHIAQKQLPPQFPCHPGARGYGGHSPTAPHAMRRSSRAHANASLNEARALTAEHVG